jgi:hypothetical protein
MRRTPSAKVASEGVTHTQQAIEDELSWLFRNQPTEDYGIDAHVEVVDGENVCGRLLALQIKSGESWFSQPGAGGWWFRPNTGHVRYWLNHSLPVVVVLYHPATKLCYWQVVNQETLITTPSGHRKIFVPEAQILDASAVVPLREAATSGRSDITQTEVARVGGLLPDDMGQTKRRSYRYGPIPPLVEGYQHRPVCHSAPILVLSGMGGVGKTQLAVRIAESALTTGGIDVLVWVSASSRQSIVADFARTAAGVSGTYDDDPEVGARRFLNWLGGTSSKWMVVLDDLQRPADLTHLWPPQTLLGQVVVTTRRRDAALRGSKRQIIGIDVFTTSESAAFLAARLNGHPDLMVGAERLAEAVEHLPLALSQAAAYLIDRQISCDEYATRFADQKRPLTALSPEADSLPDQHLDTIATTWTISVELADGLAPQGLAKPILQIASLLSPDGIPNEIFTTHALVDHLRSVIDRPVSIDDARDALWCLHRLHLVTCDLENSCVRMHALVQRATRDRFTTEIWDSLSQRIADALLELWPDKRLNTQLSQRLRANTASLSEHVECRLWSPSRNAVLVYMGNNLGNIGQLRAACDQFARLHQTAARQLGDIHSQTLLMAYLRSYWDAHLMDSYPAMLLFQFLVVRMRRFLGREHPFTLLARSDLARWQGQAGYKRRAVSTLRRVLPRLRDAFGPQHAATLNAIGSLAFWQGEMRDTAAAMSTTCRHLHLLETILGPNHPDTLTVRHNLALLISDSGDHAAAIGLLETILADHKHNLGPDHPLTLKTRHNLGIIRGHAGDAHGAAQALTELYCDEIRIQDEDAYLCDHEEARITRNAARHWIAIATQHSGTT